jgi:ParB-like chromosome segregation protein Spo0J
MFAWLKKLLAPRKENCANRAAPALSIPENAERVPLALADVGHTLLKMRAADPKMTDIELASRIGKSPSYVSRAIHAALTAPITP